MRRCRIMQASLLDSGPYLRGGGLRNKLPQKCYFFSISIVFVYIVKYFVKMHTNRHQEAILMPPDTFLSRKNAFPAGAPDPLGELIALPQTR